MITLASDAKISKTWMVRRALALALVALFLSQAHRAHASAPSCRELFNKRVLAREQSSVEIEIGATSAVVELFDTIDGTLRPLVGKAGQRGIPEELLKTLQDYVGEGNDPLSASWDLLSPQEKVSVIETSAEVRNHKFYDTRTIPGLVYRENVRLTFEKPTRLRGYVYPAGTHSISSRELFGNTAIEYMGATRMRSDLGFELHVRSHLEAGENMITARAIQRALVKETQALHEHIVAPSPVLARKSVSRIQRFQNYLKSLLSFQPMTKDAVKVYRVSDFVRRTMLYFDIQMIENGITMKRIPTSDGRAANFMVTSPSEFLDFSNALLSRSFGIDRESSSKAGSVGVRTHHAYDGDVWGIEVRYLSPRLDEAITARTLSSLQKRMLDETYFMSDAQSRRFIKRFAPSIREFAFLTRALLYSADFGPRLAGLERSKVERLQIAKAAEANDFVKMLVHDWSLDPMFADKPVRLLQIAAAQKLCTELLLRGQPSTEVMKIFVKKSAIAYEMNQMMKSAADEKSSETAPD